MSFSGLTYSNIAPKNYVLKGDEEYHSFDKAKCFDLTTVELDPNIKNKLTVSKLKYIIIEMECYCTFMVEIFCIFKA